MGDFTSGTIHSELVESTRTNIVDWALSGATVVAQLIRDLASVFEEVEFVGVVGNHGRMQKEKRFKDVYVNWDYVTYHLLSLFLKGTKHVKFDIPRCFFRVREINNHNFLILHGDNIRQWMMIPWYGIDRAVHRLAELLASQGEFFEYVCMAHFHNLGQIDRVKGEKIINGSVIGGNEFSLGNMFVSSDPKQLFFGVHKRVGITWRFPINLKFANYPSQNIRYMYDPNLPLGSQVY
jgi:hypothetical protein